MGTTILHLSQKRTHSQGREIRNCTKGKKFSIGIPKETCLDEKDYVLLPMQYRYQYRLATALLWKNGAGEGSFTDLQYAEAGAEMTTDTQEVFSQNIILKINPPTLDEIEFLKPCSYIISALQINLSSKEYFKKLSEKSMQLRSNILWMSTSSILLCVLSGRLPVRFLFFTLPSFLHKPTGKCLAGSLSTAYRSCNCRCRNCR